MADTKNTWPHLRSLQRQNKIAVLLLIPGTIVTAILFNILFMVKSVFPLMAIPWVIYLYWTNAALYGQSCPACGFPFINKQRFFTLGSYWAKRCDHCGASELTAVDANSGDNT